MMKRKSSSDDVKSCPLKRSCVTPDVGTVLLDDVNSRVQEYVDSLNDDISSGSTVESDDIDRDCAMLAAYIRDIGSDRDGSDDESEQVSFCTLNGYTSDSDVDSDCRKLSDLLGKIGNTSISDSFSIASSTKSIISEDDVEELCIDGDVVSMDKVLSNLKNGCNNDEMEQLEFTEDCVNNLRCALSANQSYQNAISCKIEQINQRLLEIEKRKKILSNFIHVHQKRRYGTFNLSLKKCFPFFQDRVGSGPPPNNDAIRKAELGISCYAFPPTKEWTAEDKKKLRRAVVKDYRFQLTKPLLRRVDILLEKKKDGQNVKKIEAEISEISEKIKQFKEKSDDEILSEYDLLDKVDWMTISATGLNGQWSSNTCELMWKNMCKDGVNQSKWTYSETEKLMDIVKKHKNKDWAEIAAVLNTGRTPFLCMKRYLEKHPEKHSTRLTESEHARLLRIVEENRIGHYIPWNKVAYSFGTRTRETLYGIYLKLNPNVRKGRWSKEESQHLYSVINSFGMGPYDWFEVSRYVPGRTANQCQRHFETTRLKYESNEVSYTRYLQLWDLNVECEGNLSVLRQKCEVKDLYLLPKIRIFQKNDRIYRWLCKQNNYVRRFFLTFYYNPKFQGGIVTPKNNVLYIQPVVKLKCEMLKMFQSNAFLNIVKNILQKHDKGKALKLPSLSQFYSLLLKKVPYDVINYHINSTQTRVRALRRRKLMRRKTLLELFYPTSHHLGLDLEHCRMGYCCFREVANSSSEIADVLSDCVTAVASFLSLGSLTLENFLVKRCLSNVLSALSTVEAKKHETSSNQTRKINLKTYQAACKKLQKFCSLPLAAMNKIGFISVHTLSMMKNNLTVHAFYHQISVHSAELCLKKHNKTTSSCNKITMTRKQMEALEKRSLKFCFVCQSRESGFHRRFPLQITLCHMNNMILSDTNITEHAFISSSVLAAMCELLTAVCDKLKWVGVETKQLIRKLPERRGAKQAKCRVRVVADVMESLMNAVTGDVPSKRPRGRPRNDSYYAILRRFKKPVPRGPVRLSSIRKHEVIKKAFRYWKSIGRPIHYLKLRDVFLALDSLVDKVAASFRQTKPGPKGRRLKTIENETVEQSSHNIICTRKRRKVSTGSVISDQKAPEEVPQRACRAYSLRSSRPDYRRISYASLLNTSNRSVSALSAIKWKRCEESTGSTNKRMRFTEEEEPVTARDNNEGNAVAKRSKDYSLKIMKQLQSLLKQHNIRVSATRSRAVAMYSRILDLELNSTREYVFHCPITSIKENLFEVALMNKSWYHYVHMNPNPQSGLILIPPNLTSMRALSYVYKFAGSSIVQSSYNKVQNMVTLTIGKITSENAGVEAHLKAGLEDVMATSEFALLRRRIRAIFAWPLFLDMHAKLNCSDPSVPLSTTESFFDSADSLFSRLLTPFSALKYN